MYDDILNISLDEIVGTDSDDEIKNERIDEIKRYEKSLMWNITRNKLLINL